MDLFELQQLDVLLRKLCADKEIMGGLSLLERGQITAASETVCSLIGKHLDPPTKTPGSGTDEASR
jgi:hypothetical protein